MGYRPECEAWSADTVNHQDLLSRIRPPFPHTNRPIGRVNITSAGKYIWWIGQRLLLVRRERRKQGGAWRSDDGFCFRLGYETATECSDSEGPKESQQAFP